MALVESGTVVFVIDDDREVRQGVVETLRMEGYDPRPFAAAEAAWRELLRDPPAAIVLDGWLHGTTSGELIRRVRASRHAATPIIVLSGTRSWERVDHDADAVCNKTGDATTLVRTVDRLVRRAAAAG